MTKESRFRESKVRRHLPETYHKLIDRAAHPASDMGGNTDMYYQDPYYRDTGNPDMLCSSDDGLLALRNQTREDRAMESEQLSAIMAGLRELVESSRQTGRPISIRTFIDQCDLLCEQCVQKVLMDDAHIGHLDVAKDFTAGLRKAYAEINPDERVMVALANIERKYEIGRKACVAISKELTKHGYPDSLYKLAQQLERKASEEYKQKIDEKLGDSQYRTAYFGVSAYKQILQDWGLTNDGDVPMWTSFVPALREAAAEVASAEYMVGKARGWDRMPKHDASRMEAYKEERTEQLLKEILERRPALEKDRYIELNPEDRDAFIHFHSAGNLVKAMDDLARMKADLSPDTSRRSR